MNEQMADRLKISIIEMDYDLATSIAENIVALSETVGKDVLESLKQAMREVGGRYDRREIYLPQVLASANAFYAAFDILRPHLSAPADVEGRRMMIGVVEGDMHDIGKNLIKVMVEAQGYSCSDLGKDVPTEIFIERIEEGRPDYVAISTLMTPTMMSMKDIIEGMEERGIRKGCKVLVGGGQVSRAFAESIGADFRGDNDRETVAWLKLQEEGG